MRWGCDLATAPPLIAVDESPDWVFLAGCSPAEPASASPAGAIMPVINLARQCFSSERRNVAYPVVSAQGSTPRARPDVLVGRLSLKPYEHPHRKRHSDFDRDGGRRKPRDLLKSECHKPSPDQSHPRAAQLGRIGMECF